jgi:hypothetical protein
MMAGTRGDGDGARVAEGRDGSASITQTRRTNMNRTNTALSSLATLSSADLRHVVGGGGRMKISGDGNKHDSANILKKKK